MSQARLKLKRTYSGTPNPPDSYPSANVNLSLAKGRWTEAGVTWRNMPAGNACDGGAPGLRQDQPVGVLTGIVQSAYQCLDSGRLPAWKGSR